MRAVDSVRIFINDVVWQNFVNSYQIYKKDREAVKNQI